MIAWAAAAVAQTTCVPMDAAVLEEGLAKVEGAFVEGEDRDAARLLHEVRDRLTCLVVPASTATLARHAVLEALAAWKDQDEDEALRWARGAHWIDPGHAWPSIVTASHPLRTLVAARGEAPVTGPTDQGLVVPRGGAVLLSGRLATRPRAPVAVPLLVQVVDRDRTIVTASWQDGTAFAPWLLGPPVVVAPPRWLETGPSAGAVRVEATETLPQQRLCLFALGGAGTASQQVDAPGDWLRPDDAASGFGGLGGEARVRLAGALGLFADARLAVPADLAPVEGWGGATVRLAGVDLLLGAGATTATVREGDAVRPFVVPTPHAGLEAALGAGGGRIEVGAAGGWAPVGPHARGRLGWVGGSDPAFALGLEGGFARTAFVQDGTDRALGVDETWAGLRVGVAVDR